MRPIRPLRGIRLIAVWLSGSVLLLLVYCCILYRSSDFLSYKRTERTSGNVLVQRWNSLKHFKVGVNNTNSNASTGMHQTEENVAVTGSEKTILLWTVPRLAQAFNRKHQPPTCEHRNCRFTFDRSELPGSDVVVFNLCHQDIEDLPGMHYRNQAWLSLEWEPPAPNLQHALLSAVIDATCTYRNDSTFPKPYGYYEKVRDNERTTYDVNKNYAAEHTKLVAWMVSHCNAKSRRDEYVKELQKYIQVDIYGKCGPLKCERENWEGCTKVTGQYKFYLSFENMLCDQYITEKVWKILGHKHGGIIPVVMGGSDYTHHLPPHSFIDVRDFKSPKALAEFMKNLDKNDSAYNEYFKWKQFYKIFIPKTGCQLCAFANKKDMMNLKKRNLHRWWTEGSCVSPHMYFRGVADMLINLPPDNSINVAPNKRMPFL